jgi:uncharacterized membrane protein
MFYFSIALAVISTVLYHIFQKSTPGGVNPFLSLTVTYAAAMAACALAVPFYPPKTGLLQALRQLNWASYALAVALVGLEVGFLLAYRAGWNISLAALVANIGGTLLLVPVGVLLYRERVSLVNLAGIVVCVVGLVLVNHK